VEKGRCHNGRQPQGPRTTRPRRAKTTKGGRAKKFLLLCPALSQSERWTRASIMMMIRKYLRSLSEPEPLGVTILLLLLLCYRTISTQTVPRSNPTQALAQPTLTPSLTLVTVQP